MFFSSLDIMTLEERLLNLENVRFSLLETLSCNYIQRNNNVLFSPNKHNTRFLPSRSGVLIEFTSGVFTCNNRAISG